MSLEGLYFKAKIIISIVISTNPKGTLDPEHLKITFSDQILLSLGAIHLLLDPSLTNVKLKI